MIPVIHVGPAAIQSSILALIVALWSGTWITERECRRRGLDAGAAWDVLGITAGVTLVAGRLVYVGQNWTLYAGEPLQILALTPGTLSLELGAVFGVLAGLAYVQHRRIPFASFLDAAAPGALVALTVWALGQFMSGDAYGMPAALPWSVFLWGDYRHPVQLYDALATWTGLIIVWFARRRIVRPGVLALLTAAWYSGVRVFVDAFRGDAVLLQGGYRSTQVIALIALLLALWLMARLETSKVS
jgi:phosphatidylglycerol---prolipoprotein diacylglyceryl transferase